MSIILETKRLILKTPELSDMDNLIALQSDVDVMKYIGQGIRTKEEVKKFLDIAIQHQEKHCFSFFSVYEKESNNFVGQAGLIYLACNDMQPDIEVGYILHKKFWGKGFATELTKALITWGFKNPSINKLVAVINPNNLASRKVLEKSGMDYSGQIEYDGSEIPYFTIYKDDSIELTPYDPQWPSMAELEIIKLKQILPHTNIIDIQHIGSTAIPGISAKPIIDIEIAVDSLESIKQTAIDLLKTLGYEYWYENPDPERMFFVKGMPPYGDKRTHHVHIAEASSKRLQGRIIFRDYLTSHPETAREYENLKKKLANLHTHDREQYTDAKTEFINSVLKKAGFYNY